MADHKKEKAINKVWPVIKVLFSTAGKKYPAFFWLEAFKTLVEILQPFLGIIISPLLVDELCTTRNVKILVIPFRISQVLLLHTKQLKPFASLFQTTINRKSVL